MSEVNDKSVMSKISKSESFFDIPPNMLNANIRLLCNMTITLGLIMFFYIRILLVII